MNSTRKPRAQTARLNSRRLTAKSSSGSMSVLGILALKGQGPGLSVGECIQERLGLGFRV